MHITATKEQSSLSGFTSFLRMNGISLSVEPSLETFKKTMVKAFKKLNVCSLCRDPLPIGRENHSTCDFCSTSMIILFYSRTKNAYLFSVSKWKTCLTSLRDKCRQGFDGDFSILMVIHHTHRFEWWCKIVCLIPHLDNFLLLPNLPPHRNYPYDTVEMVFSNEELEYYMDIIDKVIRYIERHDVCPSLPLNGSHCIEVTFEPYDGSGNQTLKPKKTDSNSKKLETLILSGKLRCEFTGRLLTIEDKVSADHVEHLVNGEIVPRFRSFCSNKINLLIGRVEAIYRQKGKDRDETLYYFRKVLNCVRGSKDDVYEEMPCYFNLRDTLLKDGEYYSKERIIELLEEEKIRKEEKKVKKNKK